MEFLKFTNQIQIIYKANYYNALCHFIQGKVTETWTYKVTITNEIGLN